MRDRGTVYLFITSEGIPPTVFDSQVLEPLRDLAQSGLVFDLLAYRGARKRAPGRREEERSRVADVKHALSPARVWLHTVPFSTSRLGTLAAAVLAAEHLAPSVLRGKACVLHCRGHRTARVGVWIKRIVPRCQIVFDMRGDPWAENPGSATDAGLRRAVARAVESACRIICVSESFRRRIAAQYPDAADKIRVIPCTASAALFKYDPETRRQVRRRLGLDDRLVFVYCGGLAAPWHVANHVLAAFRHLRETWPMAHLLLVTPDVDLARDLASELGIHVGDVTVVRASHSEVPSYLMAADIGLLLRRRDSVNAVASPTKLAEYLMTGLPVAVSAGIGDSDALFSSNDFGALIGEIGDPAAIAAAVRAAASMPSSDGSRAIRAAKAADLLSSERYLPTRLEVYAACER